MTRPSPLPASAAEPAADSALRETAPARLANASQLPPARSQSLSDRPIVDATELLSRIWQQNLPLMRDRVETLRRAGALALTGPLDAATRTHASDLAHKLAGSLGMFGFPRGTDIAREMETLLEAEGPLDAQRLAHLAEALFLAIPLGEPAHPDSAPL